MLQTYLREPEGPLARAAGWLRAGVSFSILLATILVINAIQTLSLVVRPLSKRLFRKINRTCAQVWWGLCVVGSEQAYRVRPVFTGDDVPERENAMIVANHQQMPDILALMMFGWRKKRLGDMKYFVKDVLKYVPGIGWGMLFLDCLFLKRNWEQDQGAITRTFGRFQEENIPVWLVSFVEGTRITKAKVEKSREYARSKALPLFENVLLPRTKGFVAAVGGLRRHLNAVYDVTIAYPDGIPTLWQYLKGWVNEIHIHVRRYPMPEVPTEPGALADWLLDRFREKDRFLSEFHSRRVAASA